MKLRLASYNIHKAVGTDGKRDPDRILTVIHELGADVVALQEVDRRLGRRATVLPRSAVEDHGWQIASHPMRPDSMGWHGNALLVRRGMDIADVAPVPLPVLEPRGALRVELLANGSSLQVVGMHLDLSGLRRRQQIRVVLADLAHAAPHDPAVLLGDFNEWSLRGGAMRAFGHGWQALAPGRSFPSSRPLAPLDRIVASHQLQPLACGVHHSALAAVASDHLPVWADLALPKN